MIFLPLEKTYNWTRVPEIAKFPWRELEFRIFGLKEITPVALDKFRNRLEKDT